MVERPTQGELLEDVGCTPPDARADRDLAERFECCSDEDELAVIAARAEKLEPDDLTRRDRAQGELRLEIGVDLSGLVAVRPGARVG